MADDDRPFESDERAPEAHVAAQPFYEEGRRTGDAPGDSTKVGFTARDSRNRILRGFAFLINPQGLSRVHGSRSQLQATKGNFYVDDFGPAASQITMRQLVASGKVKEGGFYTAREDVQRFLQRIWLPATQSRRRGQEHVYFHDNHFERGFEERVYFPPNSLTIERSVEQHGVWRIDLQMIGLERYPFADVQAETSDSELKAGRVYIVGYGDTLLKLVHRLAGKSASKDRVKRITAQIVALNPQIRHSRTNPRNAFVKLRPYQLASGEQLRLP